MNYFQKVSANIKENTPFFTIIVVLVSIIMGFNGFNEENLPTLLKQFWLLIYLYLVCAISIFLLFLCFLMPLNPSTRIQLLWQHIIKINDSIDWIQLLIIFYLGIIGIFNMYSFIIVNNILPHDMFIYHIVFLGMVLAFFPLFLYFDYSLLKKYSYTLICLCLIFFVFNLSNIKFFHIDKNVLLYPILDLRFLYLTFFEASLLVYCSQIFSKDIIKPFSVFTLFILIIAFLIFNGVPSLFVTCILIFTFMPMFFSRDISKWNRLYSELFAWISVFVFIVTLIPLYLVSNRSGGLLGVGFLKSKLELMTPPFIFTRYIEEWGFVGGLIPLLLFLILLFNGISYSRKIFDNFARLLFIGVHGIIFFHAFQFVWMTAGFFPNQINILPFFSYGGSQFFIYMLLFWVVINVKRLINIPNNQ